MIIYKTEFTRIKELFNLPAYRFQVVISLLCIIIIRLVRLMFPSLLWLNKVHIRYKQRLLLDRSIQVNKSSKTHKKILRVCVTYYCNVNCSFCYAQIPREEFKQHMSLADFEFLAHWAKSQGWESFRLLGGEPTVYPEFKSVLEIARRHKLSISLSTNGLYNRETSSLLDRCLIESINFSYPQNNLSQEKKSIFYRNITEALDKGIPLVASWVIQCEDDNWQGFIDTIKQCSDQIVLRFSTALPRNQNTLTPQKLRQNMRKLAKQIMDISSYAYVNNILFFFYRPLFLCMFNKEEIKFLNSISPFLFDYRCDCFDVNGDYANLITVNPDLTCYPCPVVHIKGKKITPDTTRQEMDRQFKAPIEQLCLQPLMEDCKTCKYFSNYKRQLKNKSSNLGDKTVCQGGCFGYRI